MGYTLVAPVGDNLKALFVGIKEFPVDRVILITPKKYRKKAEKLSKKLDDFTIPTKIIDLEGNLMEGMFRTFGKICSMYDNDEVIVNVATGDRMSTCAALSASFANGLKTFAVSEDGKAMLLPIMKLSYYNELSENKMKILHQLSGYNELTVNDLSKKVGMSVSLVSYHINGNYKYKGLKEFRLVEVRAEKKNVFVKLSEMGNLLLKGYIKNS